MAGQTEKTNAKESNSHCFKSFILSENGKQTEGRRRLILWHPTNIPENQ